MSGQACPQRSAVGAFLWLVFSCVPHVDLHLQINVRFVQGVLTSYVDVQRPAVHIIAVAANGASQVQMLRRLFAFFTRRGFRHDIAKIDRLLEAETIATIL